MRIFCKRDYPNHLIQVLENNINQEIMSTLIDNQVDLEISIVDIMLKKMWQETSNIFIVKFGNASGIVQTKDSISINN